MNKEGHKRKAEEIEGSLNLLLPDPQGKNVVAIVELTYGIMQHLLSFAMENRYGKHVDTHVGLPRELRKVGAIEIAEIFETVDMYRAGRWYGSKGNGDIVKKCIELMDKIKGWCQSDI